MYSKLSSLLLALIVLIYLLILIDLRKFVPVSHPRQDFQPPTLSLALVALSPFTAHPLPGSRHSVSLHRPPSPWLSSLCLPSPPTLSLALVALSPFTAHPLPGSRRSVSLHRPPSPWLSSLCLPSPPTLSLALVALSPFTAHPLPGSRRSVSLHRPPSPWLSSLCLPSPPTLSLALVALSRFWFPLCPCLTLSTSSAPSFNRALEDGFDQRIVAIHMAKPCKPAAFHNG
ncbi:hypothetical protein ACOMHN_060358 [Nucella lapillus]